jgi:hypothetical protein
MLTLFLIVLFAGIAIGAAGTLAVSALWPAGRSAERPRLPAATARQVRRDMTRRLDISAALARPAPRTYDERHWLPPSAVEFDEEAE